MKSLRILMVMSVLAAAACGGDDDPVIDAPAGTPDAGGAGLTAVATSATVTAGGVVELTITPPDGFTFVNPVNGDGSARPNAEGEGHYHVYLDNDTGGMYLSNDFVSPVDVTIPSDTTVGAHTLRVQLFENDHSAIDPVVETVVDITVQ